MKPSFATPADLADWLGEDISDTADIKRAEMTLAVASSLVRRETGRQWLDEQGNLVNPIPDELAQVTIMSAARAYTNPDGIEDVSEGIDDYNVRERRKVQDAGVYLTRAECDLLAGAGGGRFSSIGVLSTYRGDCGNDAELPVVNSTWKQNGW